ncbi:metallophosphoesterase family protein [Wenxinia marina]|uniref:Putative phosphohydrolase n=1 Tax=Wenxinia marina DSM 24838 TaxID=1123501 RepID=A0A0D0QJ51_9RHOB|nr:metallophosphoesterase family protein [Wenxinia marina]KIQ71073.1 putative phosphohydrolase [Wenxinia marina DSM 24838]GGL55062.1 phosphodiesterase [Wenxinia marina]
MTRLIHLSDLHFGRVRADLTRPLLATIERLKADLVIVSGDFTQRARNSQFRAARAFLDRIAAPTLSVPGNHDTPLDNLWVRFTRPWSRYKRHIDPDLEPCWEDDGVRVVGINTVNPFYWQRGMFAGHARRRVSRELGAVRDSHVGVAVMHHPLEHSPDVDKQLMKGSRKALAALSDAGADIALSGHLHNASAAPFEAAPGLLFVQAGTGLSTRVRGEDNSFNVLDVTPTGAVIERYAAGETPEFSVVDRSEWSRDDGLWRQRT